MAHAFGSLDELGNGYGFRKVRRALGITAYVERDGQLVNPEDIERRRSFGSGGGS